MKTPISYPSSTYRIQFHKDFSFKTFEQIISYLEKLGVQTIYASPIFKSVPGSTHGYDGLNPLEINPEIGSLDQFKKIGNQLKQNAISWLQDIVPNHMAFHSLNTWLMDVLEKGKHSEYASFFDIIWESNIYNGKLLVPFLGTPTGLVLKNHEIKIAYEHKKFLIKYFDSFYPLNLAGYISILSSVKSTELEKLVVQGKDIPKTGETGAFKNKLENFLSQLNSVQQNENVYRAIQERIEEINSDNQLLEKILDQQFYHLCYWQETNTGINYRRFFTVNSLICLNIQDKNVFDQYHQFIKSLKDEGFFQGLRIDHIDGLYDPEVYLQRLNDLMNNDTYIVVEKILQPNESLPQSWRAGGTTGYDFLALVNNLFTNKNSEKQFCDFYEQVINDFRPVQEELFEKKANILFHHMAGELDNLYSLLLHTIDKRLLSSIHAEDLKQAIGEFMVHFPVYRFYGNSIPLNKTEASSLARVFDSVRQYGNAEEEAVNLLQKTILDIPGNASDEYKAKLLHFYRRCMQYTGPLMAKGLEDTLMYTYNNFIGHNDVGDSPQSFGITKDEFHKAMSERQKKWPLTLNTTSTHDTKRGEDVRARLNVLTDLPGEWFQNVKQWQQLSEKFKENNVPDNNEVYFIYQNLIGVYPASTNSEDKFLERFQEYLQKSLREAKINSDWAQPNEEYEAAVKKFAVNLLDKKTDFWKSFEPFQQKIADFGIINSLSQVLLKFTCPGTPDVYQGCELWDLSFVDPDNRRPVNYKRRMELLDTLNETNRERIFQSLWKNRNDGKIKLFLTQILFRLRKQQPEFFERAEYIPLKVKGKYSDFVFAFARKQQEKWIIVAVPLHAAALCHQQKAEDFFSIDWDDTHIALPRTFKQKAENIIFDEEIENSKKLSVQKFFKELPFLLLRTESKESQRNAGILLHITSLPSEFSIGDMGSQAYAFADMLNRCNQKIWQILPLNPVDAAQGFSPYSSISNSAGNILLISPELLAKENFIDQKELDQFRKEERNKVNFNEAIMTRNFIFDQVWKKMIADKKHPFWKEFEEFSIKEGEWLNDFALYTVIKSEQQNKPWFQWPEELKKRNQNAIEKITAQNSDQLQKAKFLQFLFNKQWQQLKTYCNNKSIKLLGDLAFYVSYDSADVWMHPEIFDIDSDGNLISVAGTPPDAFSSEGQNWGMPVYKWDVLKETNCKWWLNRIKRNKEIFDLIRLDHFRAFSAYWEVPANQSAKNGSWKPGPGAAFFESVKNELGALPFVAEDLGEIDDAVTELRDQFNLPGMKVLQFAFDDNMPESDYIPHNYTSNFIAYTGTHDNNTTRGWYKHETDEEKKNRLAQYLGKAVTEDSIAKEFIRMAYGSVAKSVIIPVQDLLNLDESARMNMPSSADNNWSWRLTPGQITTDIENKLKELVWLFKRI
jgi:malto-oligosyltrehalose synthase/4-alpha-glucanotransferase